MTSLININGVGPKLAVALVKNGYLDVKKLAGAAPTELAKTPGVSEAGAKRFIAAAKLLLAQNIPEKTSPKQISKATQPKEITMSKAKDSKKSDKPAKDSKKSDKPAKDPKESKAKDKKKADKKDKKKVEQKIEKLKKKLKKLKKKLS